LFREAHGVSLPVVYPPIDLRARDFETEDLKHRDTILFFSRIIDYKRPEMIFELAGRFRQYRCAIMGGVTSNRRAYLASLRKRAQAANLEVQFLDNPSNRTVRDELARARFYVFPAVNEHFGMTTPEAIASGAIPFVHDSGGQQEIVPDARLRFVDSEFVGKFRTLACMPVDALSAIRDALARHIRQYSSEAFVSKLVRYLDAA
jgi:glycosyltransferase involved in cell wall biosynthesis